jgi:threonyl-tRNA synthetase
MEIRYEEGNLELPDGSLARDLAEKLNLRAPHQALAVSIGGDLFDLSHPLNEGEKVSFLHFEDKKGKEVFWHTSAHVLALAVLRLWPDAIPTIGPPIERGFYYDFANLHISVEDFPKIEKEIKKILSENLKPERVSFKNKKEALQAFERNIYKKEIIEGVEEGAPISAYRIGDFFDLCLGPHLPNLSKIKAFKLLKTSGAYWRGDPEREMLTRIYGISFPSRDELKQFLDWQEEAKRRDHRLIGTKLDLFSFQEEAPAMPIIHPKGMVTWNRLLDYWRKLHIKHKYSFLQTPLMMSKTVWERSGHWDYYREHMFLCPVEKEKVFAVKPMNCPGCMLYYLRHAHSYREFPMRIAELGQVHRREPTGALSGLFRVQSFLLDDAHHFMRPQDIVSEIVMVLQLADELYKTFGLTYTLELSTRPKESIGTDEDWEIATNGLKNALSEWKMPYEINEGDGAFYGPKIDFHILDTLGRSWQCGTVQLDLSLPERFHLEYKDSDGILKRPIMLHRAIFGSLERFFGIMIEHFAGNFPLWLSPLPIRIIPVADRHVGPARQVQQEISQAGFICDVDDTSESVSKKVRNAQLLKINYMLTIGDTEAKHQTVALRTRDEVVHGELTLSQFLTKITKEMNERSLSGAFSTAP